MSLESAAMPHLSCHIIPKDLPDQSTLWEQYAWRTRALRLDSLKLDPSSFISRYDSEVKQPIEFSIDRLKEPKAWTVVLLRTADDAVSCGSDVLLRDDATWVGFCVMINIQSVPTSTKAREGFDASMKGANWYMAAVYVERSVRGSGAGKKLIQYAIDAVRKVNLENRAKETICVTNVMHGNNNALNLYKKMGFKVTVEDEIEEKEGRGYHTTQLKKVL